ncbi:MAG: hypothetical protein IID32_07485 [Planctomycetes bacterium]|nr:hypothetical protein [Planctomycetota bacterium]
MVKTHRRKGSRRQRFFVWSLSVSLTLLFIWLLAFVDQDIGNWPGPEYGSIKERFVDKSMQDRMVNLQDNKRQLERQVREQRELQGILRSSTAESRNVMNQMIEMHRLNLEKGITPSEEQQQALAQSESLYLTRQNEFQQANDQITRLNQQQRAVEDEIRTVSSQLSQQEKPAREEYNRQLKRHRLKVASFKLLFIVPVLAIATWLAMKYKKSPYLPIIYALLIASFWRVGVVMFAYSPLDFFKYIAVAAGIGGVLAFLVVLIRMSFRPRPDVLLKQYREAYNQRRCPICEYPILRGPLKHVVWSAKGPQGPVPPLREDQDDLNKPYTCPSCGECLYDTCDKCNSIRHVLLAYCESCGQEKPIHSQIPATT